MIELCLFDLDNTLVKTDDLENIRFASKNNDSPEHLNKLGSLIRKDQRRCIYGHLFLSSLRVLFPGLKFGVFTRSPRSYTKALLEWAYPGFNWDVVVANEDVWPTKPYGNGIHFAMSVVGCTNVDRVILIGDSDIDVKAAYNAGCLVAVDKRSWPFPIRNEHWRAQDLIPDGIIENSKDVVEFIRDHRPLLPNIERLLAGGAPERKLRYVKVGYWAVGDEKRYSISIAGRSFSNHQSVRSRRVNHLLSGSIEENKSSSQFPQSWLKAIRDFIEISFKAVSHPQGIVVTVVPHRPGREPRLEKLLSQFGAYLKINPTQVMVTLLPGLLLYTAGVRSNHNEFLNRAQRFENVRDHLVVNGSGVVDKDKAYLVIDDVVTTGASLICAQNRLLEAGAVDVHLLGLSKNIGDIYSYT